MKKKQQNKNISYAQYFREEAGNAKKLFDLCEKIGDGLYGNTHIIDTSEGHGFESNKKQFRVYHSDGYCFDISCEPVELSGDEQNDFAINGNEYRFMEGVYDGFKDIKVEVAINILEKLSLH